MLITLTRYETESLIIVNLDHIAAIVQEEFGTKIWFSQNFSFTVVESQEEIYQRIYTKSHHLNDKSLTIL